MTKLTASRTKKISRRAVLKTLGATALGSLIVGQRGPFISNAEAATPTLRLLMWQPYAIKETIAAFERPVQSEIRADLL